MGQGGGMGGGSCILSRILSGVSTRRVKAKIWWGVVPLSHISVHSVMSLVVVGLLVLSHRTILYGSSGAPSKAGL